jgi:hypothetical protein
MSSGWGGLGISEGVGIFKPAGIMQVIIRNPVYLPADHISRDFFYLPGRDAGIDSSGFHPGVFKHHGSCSYDGIAADLGIVHNNCAHSDQNPVMDGAAMYDGIVANGYIIPDIDLGLLVSTMEHCAILYIHFVANADTVNIAAYHSVEPDTAIIAQYYVPYHSGIGCYETIFSELGGYAFHRENNSHLQAFFI